MLKHLKQLANDSLIYGLSGVVTKMIGILLVPIYTRIFLPEDYGIINLVNTTFFLIGILVTCALDNAAARWFYDSKNIEDHKKTFASYIWFQVVVALTCSIIIICTSTLIGKQFTNKPEGKIFIILPAISLLTNILPIVLINWYRLHRRPITTVLFTICSTLTTIGFTLLFVVKFKWGIIGVYGAITCSTILFSLIAMYEMWMWLHPKFFNFTRLKEMLKFSLPMIPAALAYWLLNSTDSYFIAFFKDKAAVGLFGVGALMASAVGLFTGAFQQAWGPFAFSIIDNADAKDVYAKVFLLFGQLLAFIASLLMMFAPEVLMLFTSPAYYESAWVTGILGYNLVLISFSYIAIIGVSVKKTTLPYATAMVLATMATIVLDIILIPMYGIEGSAIATVAAQLIVPIYIFYKGQKMYFIPYDFKKVSFYTILFLIVAVLVRKITFTNIYSQIVVKAFVSLIFIAVLVLANKDQIVALNKSVKQK